jgi:hypothetical protein
VQPATDDLAAYAAGFVAAEGSFTQWSSPTKRRFTFSVGLGAIDAGSCEMLHAFLGVGNITFSPRRKPHYDDEITFAIQSMRDHLAVTIPFMDAHLPESYKRQQYLEWRAALLDYWEHSAKRQRPCTVDGCEQARRAHGLCRHHLWTVRGE